MKKFEASRLSCTGLAVEGIIILGTFISGNEILIGLGALCLLDATGGGKSFYFLTQSAINLLSQAKNKQS